MGRSRRHPRGHRRLRPIDIRIASYKDLASFPAIERSAARTFRGSAEDAIADDGVSPVEFYIPFQTDGLVLVAERQGQVCGFAACQACADALHLWELAVRHEAQGEGVGRGLVQATLDLARSRDLPAVTLSTFREIPWNGPFYGRMGFQETPVEQLNERLQMIRRREALLGLPIERRAFMRAAV